MLAKIKENSRLVTIGACCLVTAIALSYKLTKQRQAGVERDYHVAQLDLIKLRAGDVERLEGLKKTLKRLPNFKRAVDPIITQQLLFHKKTDEAKGYFKGCSSLAKGVSAEHGKYSHTSFVIGEGDLVLALTEAKGLDESLPQGEKSLLKAFNLLRIALLEKEVGTKKGELEAWQRIEQMDNSLLSSIQEVFQVNDVTLKDFIAYRKSVL